MADEDHDDAPEVMHVNGQAFSSDDLTYGEEREVKRIIRLDLWDEDVDGEFPGWAQVPDSYYHVAAILVFMRRDKPDATLDDALACKRSQVFKDEDPPTKPARKSRATASATSGSQS